MGLTRCLGWRSREIKEHKTSKEFGGREVPSFSVQFVGPASIGGHCERGRTKCLHLRRPMSQVMSFVS